MKWLALIFVFVSSLATAQNVPTPEIQALQAKLSQEINNNIQCLTQQITVQTQLQAVTKERDALLAEKTPPK